MSSLGETIILPPAVDIHDHLRWPSPTNKSEDFESGTLAGAESGYGLLCDMPNTPGRPTWSWEEVEFKHDGILEKAWIPMALHAGSQLDKDNQPTNLDELEAMSKGTVALKIYFGLTTGNEGIKDVNIADYEPIVAEWHRVAPDKPILVHRGNADLTEIIALIAQKYNHPLHICHVSSPDEVRIVKKAKQNGLLVTCGVTPHHLFKTSHEVMTGGWKKRMQPPLANQNDADRQYRDRPRSAPR
jgi:dihydroorotase